MKWKKKTTAMQHKLHVWLETKYEHDFSRERKSVATGWSEQYMTTLNVPRTPVVTWDFGPDVIVYTQTRNSAESRKRRDERQGWWMRSKSGRKAVWIRGIQRTCFPHKAGRRWHWKHIGRGMATNTSHTIGLNKRTILHKTHTSLNRNEVVTTAPGETRLKAGVHVN